jgi:hypothetical protein
MATQDQQTAYALALQQVNDQIARLQDTASSLISTITGDAAAVQAASNLLTSERDQIATVWASGDPDSQTRAVLAMQQLAAGLPGAIDMLKAPLAPGSLVGDYTSGSDLVGVLLVGALVFLLVEHEESRGQ